MHDRRDNNRIPLKIFLNQYISDRLHRGITTNISPDGLYVHRALAHAPRGASELFGRDHRYVQLEFGLPGTGDTIWARGEIRYDELGLDSLAHGTGIHFTDMATGHRRMILDYVHAFQKDDDNRRQRHKLKNLLSLIRYNRFH